MSKFPLYDNLSKDLPETDLTMAQKRSFVKKIEKIDLSGHELIYALIRFHQTKRVDEENITYSLPYEGSYIGNDINFNIDNLPICLKHILLKFLTMHLIKMKEEKIIESQTPVKRR